MLGCISANVALALTVPRTKNGDPLELPLSNFLFDLLLTRREADPDAEWVFPGPGATGHIVESKRFYTRVGMATGIKFTLHDLRRTGRTPAHPASLTMRRRRCPAASP